MIGISQSRKLIQQQNLFTLPIFTVLQSEVQGPCITRKVAKTEVTSVKFPSNTSSSIILWFALKVLA